ncbi:hypothetical protein SMACR_05384 [Sordaria macrospora]|uniref:WGS project CABT00000000 data, contig 2.6 n=2 Tax=Sordaria macrospora TaxID=5147 RepID=F7VSS6_SORMK|nr:uncharacterized protein SMAC_05384 [Sordaria macrospora k-hell]KAA8628509.1 hypothetical protein SMACR_05384 [Sordaria macrospora]WPJ57628.1 hypothetical protein SMAC4_05384 [Sordaria macrospora]CCC08743.1 unnamed protein product [Sordaria macrospora k-hell]
MAKHSSSSPRETSGSSGGKKDGSSGSGSRTYTTSSTWYCNNCNFGPNNINIDACCPNCQHRRCKYCRVTTTSVASGR